MFIFHFYLPTRRFVKTFLLFRDVSLCEDPKTADQMFLVDHLEPRPRVSSLQDGQIHNWIPAHAYTIPKTAPVRSRIAEGILPTNLSSLTRPLVLFAVKFGALLHII